MNEPLNLENPIIVIYFNIDNISKMRAQEMIDNCRKYFSFPNATSWIIPVTDQKTKVEVIWNGTNYSNTEVNDQSNKIKYLYERVNQILELISDGTSDIAIKQKLRDLSLNTLLYDEGSTEIID